MQWHLSDALRWQQEQAIANEVLLDCVSAVNENGTATIVGKFRIFSQHGHVYETVTIRIEYPERFPTRNQPPNVYLESHRDCWVNYGDSHIEADWRLCLFVPSESGIDFSEGESLNHLFAVLNTFFIKQRIYQRRVLASQFTGVAAHWPGDDRSHGIEGIAEAIKEGKGIGRNSPCPCGSGKKYKKCHMRQIQSLRRKALK